MNLRNGISIISINHLWKIKEAKVRTLTMNRNGVKSCIKEAGSGRSICRKAKGAAPDTGRRSRR